MIWKCAIFSSRPPTASHFSTSWYCGQQHNDVQHYRILVVYIPDLFAQCPVAGSLFPWCSGTLCFTYQALDSECNQQNAFGNKQTSQTRSSKSLTDYMKEQMTEPKVCVV